VGHIVRFGHPAQHAAALHPLDYFERQHGHAFGADETWRHGVDVDVGRSQFGGGGGSGRAERALLAGVVGHAESGRSPGGR